MANKKQEVTALYGGQKVMVETSDEACAKFGFRHGQRVTVLNAYEATIHGVGPDTNGEPDEVLWFIPDNSEGKAVYCYPIEGKIYPL